MKSIIYAATTAAAWLASMSVLTGAVVPCDAAILADREAADRLRAIAGEEFRIRETDHFVIAFDTSYDAVRPLIGRLEGSFKSIQRFCVDAGLPMRPLTKRLDVILFDEYDDFADYSRRMNVPLGSIAGFYHHENNVSAFCNTLSSPDLRRLSDLIDQVRTRIGELTIAPPQSETDRALRHELEIHLGTLMAQRDMFVRRFNRTVVQHEAAHQMLFNSGVHVYGADNPPWLIEGLACQFEVPQPGPTGRLRGVNEMRLYDVRAALGVTPGDTEISDSALAQAQSDGRFLPVVDLIGDEDLFDFDSPHLAARYGQAWGLVYYLHRERPQAFAAYLRKLANRSVGVRVSRGERIGEFRALFGVPDQLFEREWVGFLLSLRATRP